MKLVFNRASLLFILLGSFFLTNALVAEFVGIKIFQLESTLGYPVVEWTLFGQSLSFQYTAGVLLWPIVFVLTDVINEYFGSKGVRLLSYLAVGMISYAFLMLFAAIALEPADWWRSNYSNTGVEDMQLAFSVTFGQGLFIIVGSLVAFLLGQILDVWVFHRLKRKTGEGKLWLRATGSTLVSQLIDSFVVLFIAFYLGPKIATTAGKPWTMWQLLAIGINNYIYKFVMALILTPIIYAVHHAIDLYLGEELAEQLKTKAHNQ